MPEEAWHPLFVEALQKQSHVEYLLDVLLSPDMEERHEPIVDRKSFDIVQDKLKSRQRSRQTCLLYTSPSS